MIISQSNASLLKFELRHLRYVIAAADHHSFRRAAQILAVEPSTVSRRIRDLEDSIGTALFIRGKQRLTLTHAGERFLQRARNAVNQLTQATLDVGTIGQGQSGVVRIGLISSMASGFISELLRAYAAEHIGVRIEYVEGDTNAHVSAIKQHQIDLAFLVGGSHTEDCDEVHLWNEQVYVAMSANHQLTKEDKLRWGDLLHQSFVISEAQSGSKIQEYLVKNLAEQGYSPNIERHAVYRDTLMQVVASAESLTITTEAMVAAHFPGVVFRPLIGEKFSFYAVWSPNNDNPALRRMLSLAKILSDSSRANDAISAVTE